ncbi:MAG TPA: hypothetical protein DEA55_11775 [Rhodospirillaceae bacterium]|nr:hypothetical protein [Rhodospirillaceae bacterium]
MQFVVIGRDAKDDKALERRMAARDAHIAMIKEGVESGRNILGAAMLDEKGAMNGSVMVLDFESREALDEWLKKEPYVTEKVWDEIEVIPCSIPPTFAHVLPQKTKAA